MDRAPIGAVDQSRVRQTPGSSRQRGFTLVELAVVLVVVGILLGSVLKGQELINNAKAKRMQSDLKATETMLWTYLDRKGRWPGDCNVNGVIDYHPATALAATEGLSNDPDPTKESCGDRLDSPETSNTPFSDLRAAHIANYETPNVVLGRNVSDGAVHIGSADDESSGAQANVIVVYDIPAWMAEMIDASFDGVARGDAGRIRRWDAGVRGGTWPGDAKADAPVSLAYFFDRTLP